MYYLDTNVIIDVIRQKYPQLEARFKKYPSSSIAVPSVVVAELEFGAKHSDNYEKRRKQYLEIIAPYRIVAFAENEAIAYGKIREQLTNDGTPIGSNDMLIASTALANNATLVTHNIGEFARVEGLSVVDWLNE